MDVDPLLPVMYAGNGKARTLTGHLVDLRGEIGGGYALIMAKNTLKRGYVHPAQPVTERERVDLGADDQTFVKTVYEMLAPGGRFLIYNLSPGMAPAGKKYIPWADGRSPASRSSRALVRPAAARRRAACSTSRSHTPRSTISWGPTCG